MNCWVRKASLIITVFFIIAYLAIGYTYLFDFAKTIKVVDIKAQITLLVSISMALFAVVGAWLALVFPTALSKISNPNVELVYSDVDEDIIIRLLKVFVYSALTLAVILILDLLLTMIPKHLFIDTNNYLYLKSIFILTVWFFYFVQIKSILRVVASASSLLFELLIRKKNKHLDDLCKPQYFED